MIGEEGSAELRHGCSAHGEMGPSMHAPCDACTRVTGTCSTCQSKVAVPHQTHAAVPFGVLASLNPYSGVRGTWVAARGPR